MIAREDYLSRLNKDEMIDILLKVNKSKIEFSELSQKAKNDFETKRKVDWFADIFISSMGQTKDIKNQRKGASKFKDDVMFGL